MFLSTLHAEWLKLATTKALWWTTSLFVVFSVGFAALVTVVSRLTASDFGVNYGLVTAETATMAMYTLGFTVLIIQAAMVFTSEYRHSTATTTFIAVPNRALVIVTKALLYSVYAAVLTFITVLTSYYVSILVAGTPPEGMEAFNPWKDDQAVRYMWLYPMAAAGLVLLTIGVAVLVRQTAGAISIMLVWFLALENLVRLLPKVGVPVTNFGPMTNFVAFKNKADLTDFFLSWQQSVWVFWAWAVGMLIIGIIVATKRDV